MNKISLSKLPKQQYETKIVKDKTMIVEGRRPKVGEEEGKGKWANADEEVRIKNNIVLANWGH